MHSSKKDKQISVMKSQVFLTNISLIWSRNWHLSGDYKNQHADVEFVTSSVRVEFSGLRYNYQAKMTLCVRNLPNSD